MEATTQLDPEAVYRAECCQDPNAQRIRLYNDALRRREPNAGDLVITSGVAAKGKTFVGLALQAVRDFKAFTVDNDPRCEGDFGSFILGQDTLLWKIDYYDKSMQWASPNAADASVTTRVLTVMLAEEY